MPSESVTLEGHIIDSLTLPTVLDEIVELGGSFEIAELRVGTKHEDTSFARILVSTDDDESLLALIERLQQLGANPLTVEDAQLATADVDGAFPTGFYSTTNLETEVRVGGRWIDVRHPEMDCGIVIEGGAARTIPMSEVTAGMEIVMGGLGIRVTAPEKPRAEDRQAFEFMSSSVSSEKPKALLVEQVADQMRAVKD
nr:TIGR00300 family protein [Actinomycetota bacterium]